MDIYVFLGVGDRSNAQVIFSDDGLIIFGGSYTTFVSLRMKMLCHICVQEGMKYQNIGSIVYLSSILYHNYMTGVEV